MSTVAEVQDIDKLTQSLAELRSDTEGRDRKAWVIVGHVDNNPNLIDVIHEDTSAEATLEDFRSHLPEDQMCYCLLRLTSTLDMSTTVKFVYVRWFGEKIPFAKKGKFGVCHGSIVEHFNPFHLLVEANHVDDLTDEELAQKLEESSGTKSNIISGDEASRRQERGFTAHQVNRKNNTQMRSIAPEGSAVDIAPELNQAIGDVRSDANPTTWILAGFEEGNTKKPLVLLSNGEGSVDELIEKLEDDAVMYGLYRTTDVIDDITTVKFVYIYWIGEKVKPMMKGKVSAFTGPMQKVFSPAHVSLSFTNRYDITEDIVKDKIMSSSGSKSHVK